MTLTDTLERLSELLPERVDRCETINRGAAYVRRGTNVVFLGHPFFQEALEGVLREEIEARGWEINMIVRPGSRPQRNCVVLYAPRFFSAHADTPAHALALALIDALEAEAQP